MGHDRPRQFYIPETCSMTNSPGSTNLAIVDSGAPAFRNLAKLRETHGDNHPWTCRSDGFNKNTSRIETCECLGAGRVVGQVLNSTTRTPKLWDAEKFPQAT